MRKIVTYILPVFLLFIYSCSQGNMKNAQTEQNEKAMYKILGAFDRGDTAALDTLLAQNIIDHQIDTTMTSDRGSEAVKKFALMYHSAFPNMKSTIHFIAASGDTVAAMMTSKGTQTGEFMGIPSTNKVMSMSGVDVVRFKDGKAVEHWGFLDPIEMMKMEQMSQENMNKMPDGKTEKKQGNMKNPKMEKKKPSVKD
jgi:predicted ester cyclase